MSSVRSALEQLEAAAGGGGEADAVPALAFLAARELDLPPDELHAAQRRALLILAAGGDPTRELHPDARAVRSLAADLDDAERRRQLRAALEELASLSAGLPRVAAAACALAADADRAWLWVSCALLAEALLGED